MKKIAVIIFALLLGVGFVNAQAPDFAKKFSDAEYHLQYANYAEALPLYVELANADPNNANVNYKAGFCYLNTPGQKAKAIPFLERAAANTSRAYEEFSAAEKRAPEIAIYDLANAYRLNGQFDKASENYNKYKGLVGTKNKSLADEIDRQIATCQFAANAMKNPVNVQITNLGAGVNTKYAEYEPFLSLDESTLMFNSKRDGFGNYQNVDGQFFETSFQSNNKGSKWEAATPLSPNLNVDENDAAHSISLDGQFILVYRDDKGNGGLFLAESKGETWNTPVELGANVNTKAKERGAALSPDGKILFFASDRKGGKGGMDIWMSTKGDDGIWGIAENVESLNTPYDEINPYFAPDGKSFYFSSAGWETMGGQDILMSAWDASSKTFSKPNNVGYPINTLEDDNSICMSVDGIRAYISAVRPEGQGDLDIYQVDFINKTPNAVVVLNGRILNNVDSTATEWPTVKVTITDLSGGGQSKTLVANYKTGRFKTTMKPGGKYAMKVDYEGTEIYKEDFDLSGVTGYKEINRMDIKLNPNLFTPAEIAQKEAEAAARKAKEEAERVAKEEAEKAAGKTNPNSMPPAPGDFKTYFKYNITDIETNNKDFAEFLKKVGERVKAGQTVTVSIEASASTVPTKKYGTNDVLAQKRAENAKMRVMNGLKKKGVDTSKITWGSVKGSVNGPEYNKDFNERRAEYEKFQYVDISVQ
jgi:Tol biopolymer transport system component